VVLFNRSTASRDITVDWSQLHYPAHLTAKVRDLWLHQDLAPAVGQYKTTVAGHSVVMLTVMP
jgi:alpha-galactosidase